ncbi:MULTISPECIES: zincin-like metallopeptidase domain-containing protein [unclassified Bosea (in: a-proteobacteria)]|uniref:ArdC family protein n=1 Tax=unclassified Bosea (in: a-proteobacteria) TaxID=2653178 RepID=UPI000F763A6E|nr:MULTISPECIES: zincin-like metallopeptidase domain-containing protein [unclassified Bosea (in: a-proteobacteria)]AZO81977.1 antirestriction protein ArdC [Bosea sp. Tri-49]RXT16703.1 antirestriction protein ArdC [Bosea sp. Tri-39]RXT42376.1 antirestriction protein ArdC [Bosea sp. Tri-54]
MTAKDRETRSDIYTRITERIVADLENGTRPWVQPWNAGKASGRITRPLRHNGQPYTGLNVLLLWSEAVARGYSTTIWMTFRQANELGAHVRKGESGATVVYASRFTKTEVDAAGGEVERDIPFLKAYTVFNCDQIEGLPDHYYQRPEPPADPLVRIEHADRFFANTGVVIRHGGSKAFYAPGSDSIQMPELQSFRDAESYVAVLGHECVHWAGAPHRLNRDLSRYHKDLTERAREELIADIGACFLCADLDIVPELEPRPDHASYVASWLKLLDGDRRAIFQAAAHAQRAVAYLHDLQPLAKCRQEAA